MTKTFPSEGVIVRYAQLRLDVLREHIVKGGMVSLLQEFELHHAPQENLYVVAVGPQLELRTIVTINRGSHNSVNVHMPSLLTAVLTSGAERFIIAHNHPSISLEPTRGDLKLTKYVMEAADICGLYLEDHIILNQTGGYYSFTENGMGIADYPKQQGGKLLPTAAQRNKEDHLGH